MKKAAIILSVIALIAVGRRQATEKQAETATNEVASKQDKVESPFSITDFQPYTDTIPTDSILSIKETCLIEISPEIEHFDDEDSEEAQNYFTAMDDWIWYTFQTSEQFKKIGIETVVAEKRYLSFTLANNEKIIVDTRKEQNGKTVNALLYKKGHIPILIHID